MRLLSWLCNQMLDLGSIVNKSFFKAKYTVFYTLLNISEGSLKKKSEL